MSVTPGQFYPYLEAAINSADAQKVNHYQILYHAPTKQYKWTYEISESDLANGWKVRLTITTETGEHK